jgi:hypothetical protein
MAEAEENIGRRMQTFLLLLVGGLHAKPDGKLAYTLDVMIVHSGIRVG